MFSSESFIRFVRIAVKRIRALSPVKWVNDAIGAWQSLSERDQDRRPVHPLPARRYSPPRPSTSLDPGRVGNVRKRTRWGLWGAMAVALTASVVSATPASAHGAMLIPGSRTYLCYEDGLTSTGQLIPQNPACPAAVASTGTTPL